MDAAAEVARIRAEGAARDAAWLLAIRARLREGPAITAELAEACQVDRKLKGTFSTFIFAHKRAGTLVTVGTRPGPSGYPNAVWGLP